MVKSTLKYTIEIARTSFESAILGKQNVPNLSPGHLVKVCTQTFANYLICNKHITAVLLFEDLFVMNEL